MHDAFEAHARAAPAAPAVLLADREVSYGELNAMANRLAHRLLDRGVGPEQFVAVCAGRSAEHVAAILAVLKAGGAILPLDPADPQERLEALIEDAAPRIVAADLPNRARFGSRETLWLEATGGSVDDSDPGGAAAAHNAVCAFYTSGSSGAAKGVVVEHRGLRNLLTWTDRCLLHERALRLPVISRLSLGVSFRQILVPLLRGEPAWLLHESAVADPVALLRALSRAPAVALNCVPHLWEAMLDAAAAGRAPLPASLSVLCLQGELPAQSLLDRSFAVLDDLELWNIYGATEIGIATAARIGPGEAATMGRPIAGVDAHLLDRELAPVGADEAGELHVGGAGLARGYLSRPALTTERFVPDPFSDRPGARLFRTGDIVRATSTGDLSFVARRRSLAKIRGFRVEPSEVEEAIGRHPGVGSCAVVVARDRRGSHRLVACAVPAGNGAPMLGELRRFLRSGLPSYMLPSRLVVLEALPTSASGKVDRRALELIAGAGGSTAGSDEDPPAAAPAHCAVGDAASLNAIELELRGIWERLLDVRSIGVQDDFFDLGGHSLLATELLTEAGRRFGVELPAAALVNAPTVRGLARAIQDEGAGAWRSLVTLNPNGSRRPFFFVSPHTGHVVGFADLARHLRPERPSYALQPQGLDGTTPVHRRVEDLAADYLDEIRSVQPSGPYLLAGRCYGGRVALEVARQLEAAGEDVALLALVEAPAKLLAPHRARLELSEREPVPRVKLVSRSLRRALKRTRKLAKRARTPRKLARRAMKSTRRLLKRGRRAWRAARRRRREQQRPIARPSSPVPRRGLSSFERAVFEAHRAYTGGSYCGPAVHFLTEGSLGLQHGWADLAENIELERVPGNHLTLMRQPHVQVLAERLSARAQAAEAS